MQAVLVMFRSDGERRSFSVTRDITVVGRREDCDLRIPLGEVSRKHARFVRDGDMIKLEDLGSANGTYLNGQRVQESLLAPGDTIQVGPVVFVIQMDGQPADDELHPVLMDAAPAGGTAAGASAMGTSAAGASAMGASAAGASAMGASAAGMGAGDLVEGDLEEISDLEELPGTGGPPPLPRAGAGDVDLPDLDPIDDLTDPDLSAGTRNG